MSNFLGGWRRGGRGSQAFVRRMSSRRCHLVQLVPRAEKKEMKMPVQQVQQIQGERVETQPELK